MKNALLVLVSFVLVGCVAGCTKASDHRTINDLLSYFKKQGLSVGEPSTMLFVMVGANDGCSVDINKPRVQGTSNLGDYNGPFYSVQIYKYDSDVSSQRKIIDETKSKGELITSTWSMPAVVNGGFILLDYDKHPDGKKIVEIFKHF